MLKVFAIALMILGSILIQPPSGDTPESAIEAFQAALEANDVKALGNQTAGEAGATLRLLAEPFDQAKAAGDRFEKALADKGIEHESKLTAAFKPFANIHFELVELDKTAEPVIARVMCGPRGKSEEETILLLREEGVWRVGAPAKLAKGLPTKQEGDQRAKGFTNLAAAFNAVAEEIEMGRLTTKQAVSIRMLQELGE